MCVIVSSCDKLRGKVRFVNISHNEILVNLIRLSFLYHIWLDQSRNHWILALTHHSILNVGMFCYNNTRYSSMLLRNFKNTHYCIIVNLV